MSLWDVSYYIALRELKYAIYDGLEMKLKVTRMSFGMTTSSLWCDNDDEWSVGLSCVFCLLWFSCRILKGVQKVTKTGLLCVLSSFLLLNGLELSPSTECDVWVTGALKEIWNSLYRLILKELIFWGKSPMEN